ncbi:efflux RND transporter periplasmic adaptor subunit [bacterium]|nr:efflux RND transporter periplasmic adaptor subunit [bacterium]
MTERHRSLLWNLLFCLLALVLGGATFAGLASLKQQPETRDVPEKTFNVEVFRVEASNLREIVIGFGTVVAEHEVEVSAQVAGEVTSVSPRLDVGESVSGPAFEQQSDTLPQSRQVPGDLLLTIDPQVYHERLSQADATLEETRAELRTLAQEEANAKRLREKAQRDFETSKLEHERLEKLFRDGTITENQLSLSELELRRYERALIETQNVQELFPLRNDQLRKRLLRLETDRKLAQIDVSRTEVRPPFSGTLSQVMVEKGQYVQPGSLLFRLTQTDRVEIAVPLHPLDFAKIAELVLAGEQPRVTLSENEISGDRWLGRVVRIAPEADSGTRTIDVFVEVDNSGNPTPLLPGMFVQARIEGPLLDNVTVIPREAILGSSNKSRIFVAKDGQATPVEIKVPRRLEGMAFVTDGLQPGEQIILTNLDVLREGSKVEVQTARSLKEELADEQTLRLVEPHAPASP